MKLSLLFLYFFNIILNIYTSITPPILKLRTTNSYDNFLINKYNLTYYNNNNLEINILDHNYYKQIIISDNMIILKTSMRKIIFYNFTKNDLRF